MKVRRMDLKNLLTIFNKIKISPSISIKTGMVLFKNNKKIEEELSFIANELPKFVSEETREYERKKEEIMLELCNKDESGNPIVSNGNYSFSEGSFKKMNERLEEYFSSLSEEVREKIVKELTDIKNFVDEEIEIDFEKFDINSLPDGVLSYSDIELLGRVGLIEI